MIVVRKHKGRSGKSVFEWRVYRLIEDDAKTHTIQLAKCRTKERAETIADHHRCRDVDAAIGRIADALNGVGL